MPTNDPPLCRGAAALARLIKPERVTQTAVAETCDVSQTAVSYWVNGLRRPSPPQRKILQARFGIPEDDWLTDEERAAVAAALSDAPAADSDDADGCAPAEVQRTGTDG